MSLFYDYSRVIDALALIQKSAKKRIRISGLRIPSDYVVAKAYRDYFRAVFTANALPT
jgi:hypothetical protein